ncbi:flagellar type III secretion system protein FliR [Aquibacillus sp. 3ASR75-11]|uniref:Flagellar biosynthetic protein FliR n=1 Tax=Terrihalobacillus insolitus TaxID=2950438 RepID=A0A9X4AMJ1_9BACI|nr:flagellar biosynthetic protein FliR [Terrihalobacillus insolitus]MDC3414122.1 flagellar type III secretion system protein FliR [Terrihalobacillus insolitus]MDC3423563.1 flagellar type III secretion system protein FliR [Terrihalobacillus insolitus]
MISLIPLESVPAFLLILVRVTSFFVTVPIFSYRNIPSFFKIGFGFFLAWMMYYTIDIPVIPLDEIFLLLLLKEAAVGLLIGLIAFIILSAIQIAGGFIDYQMGFAIANVIDPQTGAQSPLMGQYLYTIALLFLLAVNAHYLLIDGIFYSYQFIEIDRFVPFENESIVTFVMSTFNKMFVIAFQMAIPVVGSLFLVDVALGIIARTVPQLNVFVVGLPLKILVGFVILFVSMAIYIMLVRNLFDLLLQTMRGLMQLFGGV